MPQQKYRKLIPDALELLKEESPVTTAFVRKKLDVNWATAQRTLYELQNDGKIEGKSISGRNIWWIVDK